jgi:hypothetical protein
LLLFRYISVANESKQKISMATPVFMEGQNDGESLQMGFIMPKKVTALGIPKPTIGQVKVRKRQGVRFATVRFSRLMMQESVEEAEPKLRDWIKSKGLISDDSADGDETETAVYDSL